MLKTSAGAEKWVTVYMGAANCCDCSNCVHIAAGGDMPYSRISGKLRVDIRPNSRVLIHGQVNLPLASRPVRSSAAGIAW